MALLVVLALLFARRPTGGESQAQPTAASEEVAPLVRAMTPTRQASVIRIQSTGTVAVRNHVALMPDVGGRVVTVSPALRAGGAFKAGEALLVIDQRDYRLNRDHALANVAGAEAGVELAQAQSEAARANFALVNGGREAPPLVAKEPQIAQAQAQLAAARTQSAIAELALARTTFALPFAGRVAASSAEAGQMLTPGQAFGRVYALDAVEVVAPIPPDDLERIVPATGRRATARSGARAWSAVVERVAAQLDERTRFATLYLAFANDEEPPAPGTFLDIEIEGPTLPNTFALPEAAEQTGGVVWVLEHGALAPVTPRTLARTDDGWIVAAFDAKDGVVVGAVPSGRAGLRVRASNASATNLAVRNPP